MKQLSLLSALLLSAVAAAAEPDALRSCRDKNLPEASAPATELFVAIDQTTPLSPALKQLVADNIKPFLTPDHGFTILAFSAYTQGRYTEVLASGKLDALIEAEQRNAIAKPVLGKFDQCTARQPQQAAQAVGRALRAAYDATSGDIAKSDVLASLKSISSLVQKSKAQSKVVLIVSDMLENSSISSFYSAQGQAVRKIDPAKELRAVEEQQLLGNFGDARVYIIGAGLLASDQQKNKAYRDPVTMKQLAGFWSAYMSKSQARLIEFGQPALLSPIH